MVKCIYRTQFVKSGLAAFITAKSGISILNLFPRSWQAVAQLCYDKDVRDNSALQSYAEAKKRQKAPRMPPTTWAETASLLTTYALFLNMLFGKRNQHLQGLNDVRRQFMALSEIQDTLDEMYYANMIWAIIDDM